MVTLMSSARALRHMCSASQDLVLEGRGEPARRRARPRDRLRLDAVLRYCAARRVLNVAAGGPTSGARQRLAAGGVVAVAAPPAHRAPGRRPSRPCGDDYGVPHSGALDDGGAQAEGGLEYTLRMRQRAFRPLFSSWSKNKRYAGRAAAARCRLLPSGQPQNPRRALFTLPYPHQLFSTRATPSSSLVCAVVARAHARTSRGALAMATPTDAREHVHIVLAIPENQDMFRGQRPAFLSAKMNRSISKSRGVKLKIIEKRICQLNLKLSSSHVMMA